MPSIVALPYIGNTRSPSSGYVTPLASDVCTMIANSSASASPSVTRAVNTPPSPAVAGATMFTITPSAVVMRPFPTTRATRPRFSTVLISSCTRTLFGSATGTTTGSLSLSNSVARTSTSHPSRSTSVRVRKRYFLMICINTNTVSFTFTDPLASASSSTTWSAL